MAAYAHLGNNIYVGITTDTKPTAANTTNGALAFEFATNYATFTLYVNNQTTWLPATEFAETIKNKTLDSTNTISSATSLPTVTVAKGGTGATTLTGILKGNGTSAVTAGATVGISEGGTGQTTASAGFDALSGLTAAGDIIVGGASGARGKLALGTANQALKVNSGGTTLDYGTLPIAGGGTGQTSASAAFDALSGLTTAGDLIIGGASGARARLGIGTANQLLRTNSGATAPEWASTLTGLSMDAMSNTFDNICIAPSIKKVGYWSGYYQNTGGTGIFSGNLAATAVGTGTISAVALSSTGLGCTWTSGTTINSLAGIRCTGNGAFTERDLNPSIIFKIALSQTTDTRMWFGYTSSTSVPSSASDALNALSGVMFHYDSSVDGNWHIAQNNGTGASDRTTINNIAAADTSAHVFGIRAVEASTKWQYYYGVTPPVAGSTWTDINTDIPAASTKLALRMDIENLVGAAAKLFTGYYIVHVQDA